MSYSIERMPWGGLQIVVAEDVTGKMCSSLKIQQFKKRDSFENCEKTGLKRSLFEKRIFNDRGRVR